MQKYASLLPAKTFFHICIEIVKFSGELGVPEKKRSKAAKNHLAQLRHLPPSTSWTMDPTELAKLLRTVNYFKIC